MTASKRVTRYRQVWTESAEIMDGEEVDALSEQRGGNHYKTLKIQPIEFCEINGLTACQSSIVRYMTRHAVKGGVVDVEKAIHYAGLMLRMDSADWILDLPMTKKSLLQQYALTWVMSRRRRELGTSILARAKNKMPVYFSSFYSAANRLNILEAKAIRLICDDPNPSRVAEAIEAMKEIIARDYAGAAE